MKINRAGLAAALAALLLSLAACGGGGGGNSGNGTGPSSETASAADGTIQVQYEGSLSGFYIDSNDYPAPSAMEVKVSLFPEPAGAVYPVIVDAQQVLETTWTPPTVTRQSDGSYRARLTPKWQPAAGVYEGQLQLHLCKTPQCAGEYALSGGGLPYRFEFAPDVVVTAKRDGVPVNGSARSATGLIFQASTGNSIELSSNIPVTWKVFSSGTSRVLTLSSQSDRQIAGTIGPGDTSGTIEVQAMPLDTRYKYLAPITFTAF